MVLCAGVDGHVRRASGCIGDDPTGRSVTAWAAGIGCVEFEEAWTQALAGSPATVSAQRPATADGPAAPLTVHLVPVSSDGAVAAVSLYCAYASPSAGQAVADGGLSATAHAVETDVAAPPGAGDDEVAPAGEVPLSAQDMIAQLVALEGDVLVFATYDADGTLRGRNARFTQLLGTEARCHADLYADGASQALAADALWRRIAEGSQVSGEFSYRGDEGEVFKLSGVYVPIKNASGEVVTVVHCAADVTSYRRRELEYEQEIEAVGKNMAIIHFDPKGTILDYNDTFAAAMGYPDDEAVGCHHAIFCVGDHARTPEYRRFWEDLGNGIPSAGEVLRQTRDGTQVWLKAVYAPIRDESGKVKRVVKYAMDITAQKQLQTDIETLLEGFADVIRAMSSGDLGRRVEGEFRGEFAELARMLNDTNDRLAETMMRVRQSVDVIADNAHALQDSNRALTQRTEEQASSLEQTAASMEQMTATVKQNAESAQQAKTLASAAAAKAQNGGTVVESAVSAMREINEASRRIADIIGVIDEIAFQTNLLALNAAVEAARAGDPGRGFAVVAAEGRNLAQRSAEAAKEIKTLIQDSVHKVEEGSRLVDASGSTLGEIVESVKKVNEIISDIAVASSEQSEGIDQVNRAVAQMDQMTQQNAALTEETASASESNGREAARLREMVAVFQTGGASASNAPRRADTAGAPVEERRRPGRPWAERSGGSASDTASPSAAPRPAAASSFASGAPAVAPAAIRPDDDLEWAEF
jgi:methyl-accepting chemotaxis protein